MTYNQIYKLMKESGASEEQAQDTATYFEGMSKSMIVAYAELCAKGEM